MEQEVLSPATADRQMQMFSFAPPFGRLSPRLCHKNSGDYSVFSPKGSSTPITPASSLSFDEDEDPADTENRLYLAGLRLQCQEFASRYELCLAHLQDAVREAEALRLENAQLRIANGELAMRLSGQSTSTAAAAAISMAEEIRKLRIENSPPVVDSPTSVLEPRVSLPKSISVRSTGYKKLNVSDQIGPKNGRVRVSKPVIGGSQQRVYVGGGASESKKASAEEAAAAGALELEVYNQGMFKTELCNKWQETGECPYGEHCQFAHGIGELRPVIRHPRYKTEVCRMVLAGDPCPYGHRCHFRHALSPSDRCHRV